MQGFPVIGSREMGNILFCCFGCVHSPLSGSNLLLSFCNVIIIFLYDLVGMMILYYPLRKKVVFD